MSAFSEWLYEQMARRGEGLRPIATAVGVAPTTVRLWKKGATTPLPKNVPGIARTFDVDIDQVLQLIGYPTRLIEQGHAGARGRGVAEEPSDYFPARVQRVEVVGDCLEPDFHTGDILYVDPELEPQPGDIVTLRDGDGEDTIIRRLVGGRWPKLVCNHEEERYDPERVSGVATDYRRGLRR